MGTGRDVIMIIVGAVITKGVEWGFKKADKSTQKAERQKEARMAVSRHLRRSGEAIGRLDISATEFHHPRKEEVERVRSLLAEHDGLSGQLAAIGAPDLGTEVSDWYHAADEELSFVEDYVSGDTSAPSRWKVDWPEWNRRWVTAHSVKARLLASMNRIATALEQ